MENICEMATVRKEKIGLPVNIHLDDSMSYTRSGHWPRMKFQPDKKSKPITTEFVTMTIPNENEEPEIKPDNAKHDLDSWEINIIKKWVKANREALILLADMDIDIYEFYEIMIKP